jgi:hypothetical protein
MMFSGPFVSFMNSFGQPISPVDVIFKHRDCKRMRDLSVWNNFSVLSIQVSILNDIQPSIGPKQFLGDVVDGDAIRPKDFIRPRDELGEIRSVHPNSIYCLHSPVREKQVTWKHRIVNVLNHCQLAGSSESQGRGMKSKLRTCKCYIYRNHFLLAKAFRPELV